MPEEIEALLRETNERLGQLHADFAEALVAERDRSMAALRQERGRRRRGFALGSSLLLLVAVQQWRIEDTRRDAARDARCAIRTAVVGVLESAHVSPVQAAGVLSRLDDDLGTARCGGVAVCRDGSYSEAAGRPGACSHHGGVDRTIIPPR